MGGTPAFYRVRQFVRAAGSWIGPDGRDLVLAGQFLPPRALDLFAGMPSYDRRHALDVLGTLQREGYSEPDLMAAALLHDVGKTGSDRGPLCLGHRVIVVLLRALAPGRIDWIARDQAGNWRQPFYVQENHAAIGADLASQAGCSGETAELIRRHEEPPGEEDDRLLAALRSADERN